ncbi:hypothetical protein XELAEV_18029891mg [Xenopus laevis]|uniref:Uncharacterized protein n=1 Tax=Xenopus laevis TaxID=8355 RepID=A0A974CU96_XENLA|nr:hypothetical protein XELAEV_18029891mg [Xenopus laevis]
MVLKTTHKSHMIPAPPAVSSVPNTDAPQSRHHILMKQQLQMLGSAGCPGSNGIESNAAFIVRLKCAHVYAAIFPSLSHPFTAVPYLFIFPPPSASLDSMWRIDRGSKSDRL